MARPRKYAHEKFIERKQINPENLPEDIREVMEVFEDDKPENRQKLSEELEEVSQEIVKDIEEWLEEDEEQEQLPIPKDSKEEKPKKEEKSEEPPVKEEEKEAKAKKQEEKPPVEEEPKKPCACQKIAMSDCGCNVDKAYARLWNEGKTEGLTKEELKEYGCCENVFGIFIFGKAMPHTKNFKKPQKDKKTGLYALEKK